MVGGALRSRGVGLGLAMLQSRLRPTTASGVVIQPKYYEGTEQPTTNNTMILMLSMAHLIRKLTLYPKRLDQHQKKVRASPETPAENIKKLMMMPVHSHHLRKSNVCKLADKNAALPTWQFFIEMEFEDESGNGTTGWVGMVNRYNPFHDQYEDFFPSDNTTVWFLATDEDYHIVP